MRLGRAGFEVDLGCRTARAGGCARERRARTRAYLPGVDAARRRSVSMRASELELGGHDLVCLAVPARALPAVLAAHGERIPRARRPARPLEGPRAAARHAAVGVRLRALPRARRRRARRPRARRRRARARRLGRARLARPRLRPPARGRVRRCRARHVAITTDVTGRRARRLREERRRARGRGRVDRRPERRRRGRRQGVRRGRRDRAHARRQSRRRSPGSPGPATSSRPSSRAGSRDRRAGELLSQGVPPAEIGAGPRTASPRRSTASRCSPASPATRGSSRPRSTALPRWSRAGSSPSSGRRR